MAKAPVWQLVFFKGLPIVAAILSLVFVFGVMGVAAADQVVLNWETDAQGNPLQPGQVIDDEFHSTEGISLTIIGVSDRPGGADIRAVFPSDAPPITGAGNVIDPDLGSPNQTCPGGGPGVGEGGEVGEPGENCMNLGNVLILPTTDDDDNDGFIDGLPNDDAAGGLGIFIFSAPVTIDYLDLLDIENPESAVIRAYSTTAGSPSDLLLEVPAAPLGNNSYQRFDLAVEDVLRLEVEYQASGALAALAYTPPDETAVALSTIGATTPMRSVVVLALAVLLLAGMSLLVLGRTRRA